MSADVPVEPETITAEIHGTATRVAGRPSEGISTARLGRVGGVISSEDLLLLG